MLILFGVLAVANLVSVTLGIEALEWATKPLLCLVLAVYVLREAPRHRLLAAGLVFAMAGDVALLVDGQVAFVVGMSAFLVMQVCYLAVFTREGAWSGLRARPWIAGTYLVVWLGAGVLLWEPLGGLRVPVLLYGLALVTMAAFGAGLNRVAGLGGALFAFSDLLVGLGVTGTDFTGRSPVLMATYIAAQFLIVRGVIAGRSVVRKDSPIAPVSHPS
ncbi:lysoplasmalogenase [Nonomuraea cavernae]|uniref:lysoplasmalogenase n=1 Tax=Nonomuraea cavernae TaxID=2045107 RepID=UPI0033CB6E90